MNVSRGAGAIGDSVPAAGAAAEELTSPCRFRYVTRFAQPGAAY